MFSVLDIFQVQPSLFSNINVYTPIFDFFFSHVFFVLIFSSGVFLSFFFGGYA